MTTIFYAVHGSSGQFNASDDIETRSVIQYCQSAGT